MSTKLQLINVALLKAGVSQTVVQLTEDTREAFQAGLLFDPTVRETLRAYPWGFATKYADSAVAATHGDAMKLFDGSPTAPVNGDWIYTYRYPSDCLMARRLVPPTGRRFSRTPIPFIVGRNAPQVEADPSGDLVLIFTNEPDAVLEYTAAVDLEIASFTEPLFEDVLTTLLASKLAMSLSREPRLALQLYNIFLAILPTAKAISGREQQQEKPGEAEWIEGR